MKARGTPKGRSVDPRALQEIATLLGAAARRRDLLIEHLHRIQDSYGHITAARLGIDAAALRLAARPAR